MFQGFVHVVQTGPTVSGATEINVTPRDKWPDGTTDTRWFLSAANVPKETLAMALAAMTSNKLVFCEIADEKTQYSPLTRILLTA